MHPFDVVILISVACCTGFVPAIYVRKDLALAAGYFVASTLGAFGGGIAALRLLPQSDKVGLLAGGFVAAALLVTLWHLARRGRDREAT